MATAFGIVGAFARSVTVPTLPPSEYADTEVSTNVLRVARGHVAHGERINVKMDRNAMRIILR